jgi:hypothetical protein
MGYKTQSSKGKGILGTALAFSGADEEQGRKTLHRHWQIWVQELNQTLQDCLFDTDATKRRCTKNILPTYRQYYQCKLWTRFKHHAQMH